MPVDGAGALASGAGAIAGAGDGGRSRLSTGVIRGRRVLDRRCGDVRAVLEALAVLRRLHPRDDQALDLGRSLEQLVDLRVAEPLLQWTVGRLCERADQVHAGPGR